MCWGCSSPAVSWSPTAIPAGLWAWPTSPLPYSRSWEPSLPGIPSEPGGVQRNRKQLPARNKRSHCFRTAYVGADGVRQRCCPSVERKDTMKPDQVATAITNALVQGGSLWLIATIVAFLPALWTMTLILHLGRPYVLRTLRRCGLRLGADIWWMSYMLMRDAVLLLTFALSWIFFSPTIVMNAALPITGPLAALCLLLSLAVGATLYYGALVFAVEAASQDYLAGFAQLFTSSANPTVALWIMWISLVGVAIVAGWLFVRLVASANRTMARRLSAPPSRSTPEQTPAVP